MGFFGQLGNSLGLQNPTGNSAKRRVPDSISMNEFCTALLCCSRGTVVEKAAGLFDIYAYGQPVTAVSYHKTPVSRLASARVQSRHLLKSSLIAPPQEDMKNCALHFVVWSNYPRAKTKVGDVYLRSLSPFVNMVVADPEPQYFNIWREAVQ